MWVESNNIQRFILRMSEVKTLNVQYVYVADSEDIELVSGEISGDEGVSSEVPVQNPADEGA